MRAAAVLALAACGRGAPIASCDDDLRGVYASGDERWMVIDRGATLEAYPLFPDGTPGTGAPPGGDELVIAPRAIELARSAGAPPAGTLRRRYMQRAAVCEARIAVHVARCSGDGLELVLADPQPPLAFAPCAWPSQAPSRAVQWRRR